MKSVFQQLGIAFLVVVAVLSIGRTPNRASVAFADDEAASAARDAADAADDAASSAQDAAEQAQRTADEASDASDSAGDAAEAAERCGTGGRRLRMTAAAELNIEEWKDARLVKREGLKSGCEQAACLRARGFVLGLTPMPSAP